MARTDEQALDGAGGSPLATRIQRQAEERALLTVSSEAVRLAKQAVVAELACDPVAQTPDGAASLHRAVDYWALMMAPDARGHQTSLNNHQAIPDGAADTVTYVIALTDPGVANWIDPGGHRNGWYMLRWQDLAVPIEPRNLVVAIEHVPLSSLDHTLGSKVARIDRDGRHAALARRARDFVRRIGQI